MKFAFIKLCDRNCQAFWGHQVLYLGDPVFHLRHQHFCGKTLPLVKVISCWASQWMVLNTNLVSFSVPNHNEMFYTEHNPLVGTSGIFDSGTCHQLGMFCHIRFEAFYWDIPNLIHKDSQMMVNIHNVLVLIDQWYSVRQRCICLPKIQICKLDYNKLIYISKQIWKMWESTSQENHNCL